VQGPSHDPSKATVLLLRGVVFNTPVDFIIDSGAERSVLPVELVPQALVSSSSTLLSGVDGKSLPTFGSCVATVGVRSLRRDFKVDFILTKTKPILGVDFLTNYNLVLNMKGRQLVDPLANIVAELTPSSKQQQLVRVSKVESSHSFLSDHFPILLGSPDYTQASTDSIPTHRIVTSGPPLFSKPRPLPPAKLEVAKAEFDKLLSLGIVRPTDSPWASPLHLVKKADGSWRPCGDYRRLNAVTQPDRYTIPNIQTIHHQLAGATVFSRLDLVKAYHFIPMHEDDVKKTAICTPFGNFEYLRMPFGLRNAASAFQRFVDSIFRDLPCIVTYIDDLLIYSRSEEEHRQHLSVVCERLVSAGLRVNSSKSELFQPKVSFLGFSFSSQGISPLPEKVSALTSLPVPTDVKQLQRYLGMFGFYQRCIPAFSEVVEPLRRLLKASTFTWLEIHQTAFDNLKTCIKEAVELAYPNPRATYTITADASAFAIGACLHQVVDGCSSPLGFFSRRLSETETRYSTFDRELLAVFAAVRKWKDFIAGTTLTVFTDHKPLVGALKSAKPRMSDRQQRQLSFINEFLSDAVYIAGKSNVVADTLSRNDNFSVNLVHGSLSDVPVDLISIAKAQQESGIDFSLCKSFLLEKGIELFCEVSHPTPRPYVPASLRKPIFDSLHALSHPGVKASSQLVGSRYFWPSLKSDIQRWVSECSSCQASKVNKHVRKTHSELATPTKRFSTVHIDIVGPLAADDNSGKPRYLLTMVDSFTRWMEVFPLVNITAESVCRGFMFCWVARFGPPLFLISDRGTQFCSELIENLTNALGIHLIRTCAYNPKANGIVERFHRSLKASLMARNGDWLAELPVVLLGLRMHPDQDGSSCFSRVTGEQPVVPPIVANTADVSEIHKRLQQLSFPYKSPRVRTSRSFMHNQLLSCKYVWLRLDRVRKPLEAPYQGPFEVLKRCADTFTLKIRGQPNVVSIERLKPANVTEPEVDRTTRGRGGNGNVEASRTTPKSAVDEKQKSTSEPMRTRSGRNVRFKEDDSYYYF